MKPAPFTYHAPQSRAELLALLAGLEDARVLAGGQSLMPMMNLRIAAPTHLIDLNRVADLAGIAVEGGRLAVGAMTRQRTAELSETVAAHCPLLAEALERVGFQQTRNRGTVGGSIAHMDPTAELVVVAFAQGAEVVLESARGSRSLPVTDFPTGYLATQIEPDEVLVRVDFPLWAKGHGWAFDEVTRRGESFSVVSVGALVEPDGAGRIGRAVVAIGGLGHAPVLLGAASRLVGATPAGAPLAEVAAAAAALPAEGEMGAPEDYKQHLAGVLTERVLRRALARMDGGQPA